MSRQDPPIHRRMLVPLCTAAVVALVGLSLARHWLPGPVRAQRDTVVGSVAVPGSASPAANPVPDGTIPMDQLRDATLDIPAWPADNLVCPAGRQRLRNGTVEVGGGRRIYLLRAYYGDVDRDGAPETLVEIGCVTQTGSDQLLALERTGSGAISTLGRVVATTGGIRALRDITIGTSGVIQVGVGDYLACCGDPTVVQWQERAYGWTGTDFRQLTGPTQFPPNPQVTEVTVNTGALALGPAVNGVRWGTLTVTVTLVRPTVPDRLRIRFHPPPDLRRAGSGWPPCQDLDGGAFECDVVAPALGGSRTYLFDFSRPATSAGGGQLALDVHGVRQGVVLQDANPWDNQPTVPIR
jgi:hypothetical protein